ncbi:hypothetical protein CSA37_06100 [Candidatus Fermentibacteria bacterium]|nr:MAG: hypothetical protein CSA37_06100 [Candidatus Fermentibacteria bacterium]
MNTAILLASAAMVSAQFTLDRVLAVVGSEPVLHSEVVTYLIESGVDRNSETINDCSSPAYEAAMDQVIQEKLLVEAARRAGVYPEREEVVLAADESMAEARAGFETDAQFEAYLVSMGMTSRALRANYETILGDRIAGENFVRLRAGNVMASMPADAEGYFRENPVVVENILAPRVLSWIYIPVLPADTDQAYKTLSDLRAQIENGETTFSAAAAAYSQDGSAASGGDLGWFTGGDMTATFERQVNLLEPGQIAGPFTTPFGVHLVKVTDRDGDMVRASHILILAQTAASDLEAAMEEGAQAVSRLRAGESFEEMAGAISADPATADIGGFLGTVNAGSWEGELHDAVIDLEAGEISEPVVVEQGMAVAVFKRLDQAVPDWSEFSEEELQSMLSSVVWNTYYDSMVDSLRTEIPILINI